MMYLIRRPLTDPYFNLATEEHLLKTASQDLFSVYVNDPCVVIGKHQNYSREINHQFVSDREIPIIRRITGGGTVYHDQGNLNFSFIFTNRKDNPIDFRQFTLPIIHFLLSLGIPASFEGKSNIMAGECKISGNAAHVYRGRVLYQKRLSFPTTNYMKTSRSVPKSDRWPISVR